MFSTRKELIESSMMAEKPNKKDGRLKPYSFPNYMNGKIPESRLKFATNSLIEFVKIETFDFKNKEEKRANFLADNFFLEFPFVNLIYNKRMEEEVKEKEMRNLFTTEINIQLVSSESDSHSSKDIPQISLANNGYKSVSDAESDTKEAKVEMNTIVTVDTKRSIEERHAILGNGAGVSAAMNQNDGVSAAVKQIAGNRTAMSQSVHEPNYHLQTMDYINSVPLDLFYKGPPEYRVDSFITTEAAMQLPSFIIDPDSIMNDPRKTCMIRNIPNKLTVNMLIGYINVTHFGKYDFLYLRMDFKNKCNVGYAFINFVDNASLKSFYHRISGKKWCNVRSSKVADLTYASIQGLNRLVKKFRNSSVMLEHKNYRPKVFYVSGENVGKERPFEDELC